MAHGSLEARFAYLSTHGNSSCSQSFMDSIASMPAGARLQGSCCSPMVLQRYIRQVEGLKKYANVPEIPPNPYDIDAGLAKKMLAAYSVKLTGAQQAAYTYAMRHSAEKGPCCCKCWRWHAYGGLAKMLIRDHRYTGPQVTEVWNLSDGCGGNG
ncbi:MAG TPA: hypothetical protein VGR91_14725 [Stellaceae bacterium]|nr:hypothetical protein [Stellaceae bacterium]